MKTTSKMTADSTGTVTGHLAGYHLQHSRDTVITHLSPLNFIVWWNLLPGGEGVQLKERPEAEADSITYVLLPSMPVRSQKLCLAGVQDRSCPRVCYSDLDAGV
jgi:hypothetical protein